MELLAKIETKNGKTIDICRNRTDIEVTQGDSSLVLPKLSGIKTIQLLGILETAGEIKFPDDEE